jgi:hypothetical protein
MEIIIYLIIEFLILLGIFLIILLWITRNSSNLTKEQIIQEYLDFEKEKERVKKQCDERIKDTVNERLVELGLVDIRLHNHFGAVYSLKPHLEEENMKEFKEVIHSDIHFVIDSFEERLSKLDKKVKK